MIYLTEALLSAQLLSDPTLLGVDYVFLDEFHERSLSSDLALGMVIEGLSEGEKVIVEGLQKIGPGMPVKMGASGSASK